MNGGTRNATCFLCASRFIPMENTAQKRGGDTICPAHVLIVDDDIELLLVCQQLLETYGYQVSTAQNGVEALKVMKSQTVDAILCDLDMPELSGDLFYMAVGRTWPQLQKRFIFVTGHAEDTIYQGFLRGSKVTVLSKPVPVELLLAKLEAALGLELDTEHLNAGQAA